MLYFKDSYVHNSLDARFMNPPFDFHKEMGIEIEDDEEFCPNLMDRFYQPEKVRAS